LKEFVLTLVDEPEGSVLSKLGVLIAVDSVEEKLVTDHHHTEKDEHQSTFMTSEKTNKAAPKAEGK
jgi:hypothetical protein